MSFCSLIKGIIPTVFMSCFVLINSVILNLSCVLFWASEIRPPSAAPLLNFRCRWRDARWDRRCRGAVVKATGSPVTGPLLCDYFGLHGDASVPRQCRLETCHTTVCFLLHWTRSLSLFDVCLIYSLMILYGLRWIRWNSCVQLSAVATVHYVATVHCNDCSLCSNCQLWSNYPL